MSNLDIAHCTLLIGHWRPRNGRFMGREHLQNRDVSWGHEPDRRRSRSQVRFTMYGLRAPRRADRRACESRRAAIPPSKARKSYIENRKSLSPGDRQVRIARFMGSLLGVSPRIGTMNRGGARNPQSVIRNPQSGGSWKQDRVGVVDHRAEHHADLDQPHRQCVSLFINSKLFNRFSCHNTQLPSVTRPSASPSPAPCPLSPVPCPLPDRRPCVGSQVSTIHRDERAGDPIRRV